MGNTNDAINESVEVVKVSVIVPNRDRLWETVKVIRVR